MQRLEGIRQDIVCKLNEVATRCPSPIAWDPFAFPLLLIRAGEKKLYVSGPERHLTSEHVCPVLRSCSKTTKGIPHTGRALIFEGSMLVYDPPRDLVQ